MKKCNPLKKALKELNFTSEGHNHTIHLPAGDVLHIKTAEGKDVQISLGAPAPWGSTPQVINIELPQEQLAMIDRHYYHRVSIRPLPLPK